MRWIGLICLAAISLSVVAEEHPDELLWGDVHLHSNLSWDAYYGGNETADVDTAYRFAKGIPVIHPFHRAKVSIEAPLDFLAVTDHAEFLGLPYNLLGAKDQRMTSTRLGQHIAGIYERGGIGAEAIVAMILAFQTSLLPPPGSDEENAATRFPPPPPGNEELMEWLLANRGLWDEFYNYDVMRNAWQSILEAAERHYEPGQFTTLIGWEYSPQAGGGNLHRVVLTPASSDVAEEFRPFSFLDSDNPEHLWNWLETTKEETGADFVAIPHNSNLSMGRMFSDKRFNGEPIDESYASSRARWETVAEITQVKGTSETHPLLSPDDEFASFGYFGHQLASFKDDIKVPLVTEADYIRSALKNGMRHEAELGINPFKLGVIGSTDNHTSLTGADEANFHGKYGQESLPEEANKPIGDFNGYTGWDMSSSGLAAVWARENTREEVFAAFKRREVYGTSGPRIGLRFFGGFDFRKRDLRARDLASVGYRKGVPMGGDLNASDKPPSFLIHASKDPRGANLDRVQVIKGWLDATGGVNEKVFNIVWSGDRMLNDQGGLKPVEDTVDRGTGRHSDAFGSVELSAVWRDPEFDPGARAFYYVRVLEIPTGRHSLHEAIAAQVEHPAKYPQVIQERAYSSPIWYTP